MGAELSLALVRLALELAGAVGASEGEYERDGSTLAPDRLGAHHVLRYATADEAETYRRIMRVLYLEHQAFGLRLRPAQVADRLRERYATWPFALRWLMQNFGPGDQYDPSDSTFETWRARLFPRARRWSCRRGKRAVTPDTPGVKPHPPAALGDMTDQHHLQRPPDVLDELTTELLGCGGVLSQIVSHAVRWEAAGGSTPDAAPVSDVTRALVRDALQDLSQHHAKHELRRAAAVLSEATTLLCDNIFLVPPDLDGT